MSEIAMAEMRQTKKTAQDSDKAQSWLDKPKIETIHDIKDKRAQDVVVDAFRKYLMSAEYRSPDEKMDKNWLDSMADTFGIHETVRAAEMTRYKSWANMGIGALMNINDSLFSHECVFLERMAKRSEMVASCLRGRILDYGCNVGWLVMELKKKFGSEVIGIDIDRNALELGRFFGATSLLHTDEKKSTLPFPDGQFDAVALRHILDAYDTGGWTNEMILDEISRMVKDGGVLLLSGDGTFQMRRALRPYGLELIHKEISWSAWKKTNVKRS